MSRFEELYPGKNNFCRVFELPLEYPPGFCFAGGIPVVFTMVDWFNPWPAHYPLSSFMEEENYPNSWEECKEGLKSFLLKKQYLRPGRQYLLVTDFGETIMYSLEDLKE